MRSRLQAVGEEDVPTLLGTTETIPQTEPKAARAEPMLMGLLITSLRALSQRAIVALASLIDLALLASVFVLLLLVIGGPTGAQLIAVAGYGIFCLCALLLRRRKV